MRRIQGEAVERLVDRVTDYLASPEFDVEMKRIVREALKEEAARVVKERIDDFMDDLSE